MCETLTVSIPYLPCLFQPERTHSHISWAHRPDESLSLHTYILPPLAHTRSGAEEMMQLWSLSVHWLCAMRDDRVNLTAPNRTSKAALRAYHGIHARTHESHNASYLRSPSPCICLILAYNLFVPKHDPSSLPLRANEQNNSTVGTRGTQRLHAVHIFSFSLPLLLAVCVQGWARGTSVWPPPYLTCGERTGSGGALRRT